MRWKGRGKHAAKGHEVARVGGEHLWLPRITCTSVPVPLKVIKEVVAMYSHGPAQTDFHVFAGRGHSLTIDNGWKDVADVALQWLAINGF